jgi:lipid biosynthesis B12-binding/radical SAM protein
MSKVFLLSANYTTQPYPVYPLGMAIIAGALEAGGHATQQCDFLICGKSMEAVAAAVTEFQPDVISMTLRNIDNIDSFSQDTEWYLAQARELVEVFRSCSNAPIVIGGSAFTIMPEEILAYLGCEHGVVGEGEGLICELVEGLAAGKSMPRLSNGEATPLCGDAIGSCGICGADGAELLDDDVC